MAVEVKSMKTGTTEIALSPDELGKVTLTMKTVEGSVTMLISAERPETQDLMRRHIETLGQEFRSLGFTDISFSFQGQGRGGQGETSGGDLVPDVTAQVETPEILRDHPNADGLDLRL
ncbi:MAG: flagellar hook-length control protein FliK [Yoonia sp.]|nr:flagellar hook-length control protein FliK [Yoonia sp.]